jgi:hypothetical protein
MQATSELEGLPAPTGRHQVGRVSFDWVDLGQAAATPPVLAGPSGAYPELTFGPP